MVLIVASVFGALSYLPFVTSVMFYPTGSLVSSDGYLNRSSVGNGLQMVYGLALLGLGYAIGKKIVFQNDYLWLMPSAYFGAVIGYIVGLPGLETTTVSGGVFLFETNVLNAAHIQSALFNSATLMGLLVAGIGLSSVFRRRGANVEPRGEEDKPTGTNRLISVFVVAAVIAFLAYMLPSIFSLAFSKMAGPSAATSGFFLSFQTNSIVIANPLLFFVLLYFVGSKVNIFHDARKVVMLLFVAVLIGSIAGNPIGSYAAVSVVSGMGMFPNYLTNTTSLATLLTAAFDVSFAGTFLGFAAISVSASRRTAQSSRKRPLK